MPTKPKPVAAKTTPMPTKPKPAPRQTRAYPTILEWASSDENKAFVAGLMCDPRFLAILHYSKDIFRVQLTELVGERPESDAVIARRVAIRAGAEAFEECLKGILRHNTTETLEPQPWEYINPEPR